ncbi:MAG: hypothetical protein ACI3ZF_03065 [Candidatus Cryptobacteroides sp.]
MKRLLILLSGLSLMLFLSVSCSHREVKVVDFIPLIHDVYVNNTEYKANISWTNSEDCGSAPTNMEISVGPGETYSQDYDYESAANLNILYLGASIVIRFEGGKDVFFPEEPVSAEIWKSLPHTTLKEQVDNRKEFINTFYLSDIYNLINN